ncbi:hypothetical protein [Halanaerobium hydrogeniformans]|uniref:Uncharacterized protein n=1 Tax=Halanaerobium hydrogeniformans TaxID=656519 RepID=E4RIZ7_HALHG|nr:hypothetical protein [Halanaerobium hydrogeniformans]ADQ15217.1 hypothetical protein Halsa_1799 [Halanaerobium hydrogeniformans]
MQLLLHFFQVNLLIENLKKEIIKIVDQIKERNDNNELIKNKGPDDLKEKMKKEFCEVKPTKSGYIQLIYDIKLSKLADKYN